MFRLFIFTHLHFVAVSLGFLSDLTSEKTENKPRNKNVQPSLSASFQPSLLLPKTSELTYHKNLKFKLG